MSRLRWIACGIALVVLATLLFRPTEPVAANPPPERSFPKDCGLRVTRKAPSEVYYLKYPESIRVGDRAFLYGKRVSGITYVYIPVSEIEGIEEYGNVDDMKKANSIP
jgi:hypothetical protein